MSNVEAAEVRLGPLRISRLSRAALAAMVEGALEGAAGALGVAFCNAHTAEIALRDPRLAQALSRFALVNDGIGIELGARLATGRGFLENLNGTDFLPFLLSRLSRPTRVYLLGARPGVAEAAARHFEARFPNFIAAGHRDGYFDAAQEHGVAAAVRASEADIVLVAMGNPRQEIFIADHMEAMGARAAFAVGALFDFAAGATPRAPAWLRGLRLEWAYRLWLEPRRLARRYTLEASAFLIAALRLRFARPERRAIAFERA